MNRNEQRGTDIKIRRKSRATFANVAKVWVLLLAGVSLLLSVPAQAVDFALDQTLSVAGTTSTNRVGDAVAATATYMVAGSPMDDTLGTDAGAVYVFKNSSGTWAQYQKLTASDGATGDQFGAAVAINGTTLTVGAPLDDVVTTTDAGSVYTFDLEGTEWLQTQKLTTQTPANYQRFGSSVDMDAQRIVAGMPGYNGATSATTFGRGGVSIWMRSGLNWDNEFLYTYTSPVVSTMLAAFGHAVAISGDRIAVGAPRDYATSTGQGSMAGSMTVLLYNSVASSWTSEQRFVSTIPSSSDNYGHAVDINGNTLVAANYNIQVTAPRIFVYTRTGSSWSSPTEIIPTTTTSARLRYIGRSAEIAPDESSILIGSYVTVGSTDFVGRVYVLRPDETSGVWTQTQEMSSPTAPTSATWYGYDVAYAGSSPVITAPNITVAGGRGAVYTYTGGDATPPTFSFSSTSPTYLKSPYTVTIDASEPVTGFTQSDLTITSGATLSNFTQLSSTQYSVLVSPTQDGTYHLRVDAGMAQDLAGNPNQATGNFTRIYDTTAPNALVTDPSESTYFSTSSINATVQINDTNGGLTGLTEDDIAITNGTISNFAATNGTGFIRGTFTITPTSEGQVSFYVKAGAVADQAGNDSAQSATRTIYSDTTGPTPTFSTALNPTNITPFSVTLTFDEPIGGAVDVSAAQIGVTNGVVSGFERITSQEYQFMVTPASNGEITLDYQAGQVKDRAGNDNLTAETYSVVYDNFGAEVNITSSADNPTNTAPIPFSINVSEAVDGLNASDFTIVNGSVAAFVQQSGTLYTMTVTPDSNGDVSVSLPAQQATDSAGNGNQASNVMTVRYDTLRPNVVISHGHTSPTNEVPLSYDIQFSEAVSNLAESDVQLTNATLVSLTKADSQNYELIITPQDGTVTVQLADGVVEDAAGNPNRAATSTLTYDGSPPSGTVDMLVTNNTRPALTGTVSEQVKSIKVTVDGATFNGTLDAGGGTWHVNANLFGPLADDTYDVAVTFTDMAGNTGNDTTSDELTVDTNQPHVTITSLTDTTNQNPISFMMNVDRSVSGLEAEDFTVTNGSVSGINQQSDTEFIIEVTPGQNGPVTLQLDENAVYDDIGNYNPSSNIAESVYDSVPPQLTLNGSNAPTKNAFSLDVNTSEEISGLTVGDITVTNATITNITRAATLRYTLQVQPIADGEVRVEVPADTVTDLAGNLNLASNVFTRQYDTISPASPTVDALTTESRQPKITGTFDSNNTAVLQVMVGKQQFQSNLDNTLLVLNGNQWEIDFSKSTNRLEYGVYDIHVTTRDVAGNASSDTTTNELVINSAGTLTATVDRQITAETQPELSGTVSHQNARIYVKILDDVYEATNKHDGSWVLPARTINPLADGTYDVQLTMEYGNLEGTDTTKDELTIDTAAPRGTFTRIVTTSGSPRLYGTVDTSNTRVWVELDGKTYEADVTANATWEITAGTISPELAPGVYTAILYLERNDSQAMSVVRQAIRVHGDIKPPEGGSSGEPDTNGGTSQPPITSTVDNGKDNKAESGDRDSRETSRPNVITPPQEEVEPIFPDKQSTDLSERDPPVGQTQVLVGAAVACVLLSGSGLVVFMIGWKRKRKNQQSSL